MRAPKSSESENGHKRGRRLAGGPRVDEETHTWWTQQAKQVAQKEHLPRPSIPLLYNRVMQLDPDLTQEGVNRALQNKGHTKKR